MDELLLQNQLCFPLYAAARRVVALYTPYLSELHLTYTQYLVLMVLWETDGIGVGEICKRLYLDSGTVTPLLKKLEENGWIERRREAADERRVRISLTTEGWEMRDRAKTIPQQVGQCIPISEEEAKELYRTLYQILDKPV